MKRPVHKIAIPRRELVEEHKELVKVLRSPSRADNKREAKEQARELQRYKRGKA